MNSTLAMILVYRLLVLAGTAYLVQWHDWSAWWFVLTIGTLVFYDGEVKK